MSRTLTISYFAEYESGQLIYTVSKKEKEKVVHLFQDIKANYQTKYQFKNTGWLQEIEPQRLSKKYKNHEWLFALYQESASGREDGQMYQALIFRDKQWETFGIIEWLGGDSPAMKVREKIAHRIVVDKLYRERYLSDDPDIVKMWNRR